MGLCILSPLEPLINSSTTIGTVLSKCLHKYDYLRFYKVLTLRICNHMQKKECNHVSRHMHMCTLVQKKKCIKPSNTVMQLKLKWIRHCRAGTAMAVPFFRPIMVFKMTHFEFSFPLFYFFSVFIFLAIKSK